MNHTFIAFSHSSFRRLLPPTVSSQYDANYHIHSIKALRAKKMFSQNESNIHFHLTTSRLKNASSINYCSCYILNKKVTWKLVLVFKFEEAWLVIHITFSKLAVGPTSQFNTKNLKAKVFKKKHHLFLKCWHSLLICKLAMLTILGNSILST